MLSRNSFSVLHMYGHVQNYVEMLHVETVLSEHFIVLMVPQWGELVYSSAGLELQFM
jgi:hypothetical protein